MASSVQQYALTWLLAVGAILAQRDGGCQRPRAVH
jgi:hypothetical protein